MIRSFITIVFTIVYVQINYLFNYLINYLFGMIHCNMTVPISIVTWTRLSRRDV